MKTAILLFILFALTSCYETTVSTRTPFGDVMYKTPARYDGKTMLPPEPAPTPAREKKGWWPF